jgi:2-oxoglutarate dehydrogenase E1 component
LREIVDDAATVDVISRPDRSSPAAGFWDLYMAEQEQILAEASTLPLKQPGGKHVR